MIELLVSFHSLILVIHFLVAIFLIVTILLQSGKGGDVGGVFGSGGSSSLFGARGATTLLSKLTTYAAILFLLTSVSLALIAKFEAKGGDGDLQKLLEKPDENALDLDPDTKKDEGQKSSDGTKSQDGSEVEKQDKSAPE